MYFLLDFNPMGCLGANYIQNFIFREVRSKIMFYSDT